MSKLKLDKINFDDDDFVVEIKDEHSEQKKEKKSQQNTHAQENLQADEKTQIEEEIEAHRQKRIDEADLILNRAKDEAQKIVDDARNEASELSLRTKEEVEENKNKILQEANDEAQKIIQNAKETSQKEAELLVSNSKEEIEKERIKVTTEGYQDGHKEGLEKISEELEEKIENINNFCKIQYEIRDKILKSANKDMLDLIFNITKKILKKETDAIAIDKIIKSTINLLERKENINIILSEKYARMLFEVQKKALDDGIEFNFEDFKQYDGFNVTFQPDFDEDTIIVENLKERYDASVSSQLDVIVRDIYAKSQNGKLDMEQYIDKDETE